MEELRAVQPQEVRNVKKKKKKPLVKSHSHIISQTKKDNAGGLETPQRSLKRILKSEPSTSFQLSDRSTPDSFPDSSRYSDEYRALRRKFLLLEEQSFDLGKELSQVEGEVKSLEDEKLALLDQLVVMEGLIDASEIRAQKGL